MTAVPPRSTTQRWGLPNAGFASSESPPRRQRVLGSRLGAEPRAFARHGPCTREVKRRGTAGLAGVQMENENEAFGNKTRPVSTGNILAWALPVPLAVLATMGVACSSPPAENPEDVGAVRIALTQVPDDVQCLEIKAAGVRTVSKRFSVIPPDPTTLEMAGLPLGSVTFSATALAEPCDSSLSTEPTWVGDPVSVTIVKGDIAEVTLNMHRNGRASINVGFCDTDIQTDPDNCGSCGHTCPAGTASQPTCADGVCGLTCDPGHDDCDLDPSNGCEVSLDSDANNCNGCGNACAGDQSCRSGVCLNVEATVGAGEYHSCAIVNGGVRCWGSNHFGQLGNNSATDTDYPTQVQGLTSGVTAVAAGFAHTCAIVNGGVQCWGANENGQLGNNSTTDSLVPVQVQGLTSGVTAIAAASAHTCAVVNGAAKCWGWNLYGQLGANSQNSSAVPVQVQGLTSGVTAVAAGGFQGRGADGSCAVVNGGAQCWGQNSYGTLGNDSTLDSPVPVQVQGLTSGVAAIASGQFHTCAIVNGGVQCWGLSDLSFPEADFTRRITVPVPVQGLASGVTYLAAGYFITCAVVDGEGRCLGTNSQGEIGDGSVAWATAPVPVQGLTSGVTALAIGSDDNANHVCAMANGSVKCWGQNLHGELGNGVAPPPPPCGECVNGQERCDELGMPIFCFAGSDGCGHWTSIGGTNVCTTVNPWPPPGGSICVATHHLCYADGAGCKVHVFCSLCGSNGC